jgi:glutamate N-acetyltransferase/amino-acid N-acetyltransferase
MSEVIEGGVTAPAGFRAAALAAGIKARGLDLALLVADRPVAAAGIFTVNLAKAAPVLVSREHLASSGGSAQAIVVNSGCANACTGPEGLEAARTMASVTAQAVGCAIEQVLVASTGVIGVALPIAKVTQGIARAATMLGRDQHAAASRAIMTTDPFPKACAARVTTPRGAFAVGGMAKGSGMIEPRMATMLGFVTTDAAVSPALLHRALVEAARDTFNAITVDGEPSTNDTVFAMASGASGVAIGEDAYPLLVAGLRDVCHELALGIVRGGEGATKLVAVRVTGARDTDDARRAARAIANSLLVKTAIHGADPNWGRLVAAAGRSGSHFDLDHCSVRIGDIVLFAEGRPFDDRAPRAAELLTRTEIAIGVDLGTGGSAEATVWTCDLSAEYVKINAAYRT